MIRSSLLEVARCARGLLVLGALFAPVAVLADEPPKPDKATLKAADSAFERGKDLLQKKKYAEACAAFEESVSLVPAIGAKLNVARCYEQWGKAATAYRHYASALEMATAAKDERVQQIAERIEELDREVPKLTIALPPEMQAPAGLVVLLDGAELAHTELGKVQRVDPGAHAVIVRVPDKTEQSFEVTADAKKPSELMLPLEAEAKQPELPLPPPAPKDPGRSRRMAGLLAGGAGLLGLGVATYLAIDANGDYDDAFAAHCSSASNECTAVGQAAIDDARNQGTAATIIGGVALAAVATGVVLYFTAPKDAGEAPQTAVRPLLWNGGAGLAISGAL